MGGFLRVVPANEFVEAMGVQVGDAESIVEFLFREAFCEVLLESGQAVFAVAVVPVEVVGHEAVRTSLDASLHPCLQNYLPVRVAEACKVFLHAAYAVTVLLQWFAVLVPFEEVQRILHGFRPQFLFVP